jgi:hypothetical protein
MTAQQFSIAAQAFLDQLSQYWLLWRILMIAGSIVVGGLVGGFLAIRRGISSYF